MSIKELFKEYFKNGGVEKNDKILLHSNLSELFKISKKEGFTFDAENLLDFITEYIGPNGTLILPSFNFDFCSKGYYSFKETVSKMGVLTEIARVKAGKNKTWHPVYPFTIFGKIPEKELSKKDYSALGKDSIFNWLVENEGKIAIMNLDDQNSMTFYHHVEEIYEANWRIKKIFPGKYKDFLNKEKDIKAIIYVRDITRGVVTKVDKMEELLWKKNLYVSNNDDRKRPAKIDISKIMDRLGLLLSIG